MLTHEYTYAYGAVDVVNGELDSLDALEDQLQTGLLALENVSWD